MRPPKIGVTVGLLTVVGLISAAAVLTAAKPAPPSPTPATVTFRCYEGGDTSSVCENPPSGDLVRSDDMQTYTTGTIGSTGMYLVRLTAGLGRWLNLYFYQQTMVNGSRACFTSGNCNPDGPLYFHEQPWAFDEIELRTKPLVDGTWNDLPGGLFAMSCTATSPSPGMVHFTFWLPSGNGHWGLNFNPRSAAGSTAVRIERTALRHWTVATVPLSNLGGLLSWGHSGLRGKNGPSIEGVFSVPFRFTIDADANANVPNGNCTS